MRHFTLALAAGLAFAACDVTSTEDSTVSPLSVSSFALIADEEQTYRGASFQLSNEGDEAVVFGDLVVEFFSADDTLSPNQTTWVPLLGYESGLGVEADDPLAPGDSRDVEVEGAFNVSRDAVRCFRFVVRSSPTGRFSEDASVRRYAGTCER